MTTLLREWNLTANARASLLLRDFDRGFPLALLPYRSFHGNILLFIIRHSLLILNLLHLLCPLNVLIQLGDAGCHILRIYALS